MLSNVKDNPHGKEFKTWAKRASHVFTDRGVEVTTKHSYEIEYRYIWLCAGADGKGEDGCGLEYKRHSKSVDPKKQGCGKCKGRLVQVKPVPKATVGGDGAAFQVGGGEYRSFVKANYAVVKKENPQLGMGEVMREIGKRFRESRERSIREKEMVRVDVQEVKAVEEEDQSCGLDDLTRMVVDLTV